MEGQTEEGNGRERGTAERGTGAVKGAVKTSVTLRLRVRERWVILD